MPEETSTQSAAAGSGSSAEEIQALVAAELARALANMAPPATAHAAAKEKLQLHLKKLSTDGITPLGVDAKAGYRGWCNDLAQVLLADPSDLLPVITGEFPYSKYDHEAEELWRIKNAAACIFLKRAMTEERRRLHTNAQTAAEIWRALEVNANSHTPESVYAKEKAWRSLTLDPDSTTVEAYWTELLDGYIELQEIRGKDNKQLYPLTIQQLFGVVLQGLPAEWDSLLTELRSKDPETLTLDYIRDKLISYELNSRTVVARANQVRLGPQA